MPRISIQQFRATLGGGARGGVLVRAYRELSRRPELAGAMRGGEWAAWPAAVNGARFADWPVWNTGGRAATH